MLLYEVLPLRGHSLCSVNRHCGFDKKTFCNNRLLNWVTKRSVNYLFSNYHCCTALRGYNCQLLANSNDAATYCSIFLGYSQILTSLLAFVISKIPCHFIFPGWYQGPVPYLFNNYSVSIIVFVWQRECSV